MADTYEVLRQSEVLDTSDVTNPQPSMAVSFRSKANGTVGTVTIPLSAYSAAEADRIITKRVADIDAVHEL